jgi:hypothetical protein
MPYLNEVRPDLGPLTRYRTLRAYSENILEMLTDASPGVNNPYDPTMRLFGIELELQAHGGVESAAGDILSTFAEHPIFICKSDVSTGAPGFEMVHAPLPRHEALRYVTEVAPILRRFASSHSSCGTHIHTTRPGVPEPISPSELTPDRFGYYPRPQPLSRIEKHMSSLIAHAPNKPEFENIAGRAECTWGQYQPIRTSHGHAISISEHHGTLEFRMFSSTLHRTRLRGYIEFVDAIIAYGTMLTDSGAPVQPRTFAEFQAFIESRGEQFSNLKKVIANRYPTHLRRDQSEDAPARPRIAQSPTSTPYGIGWGGPTRTYGRRNRANRVAPVMPGADGEPLTARLIPERVHRASHANGNGPTNREVALWIVNNSSTVRPNCWTFDRHALHRWYSSYCNGQHRSDRGVVRTGDRLNEHAVYHANQVLQHAGFVRNAQPWSRAYTFEVRTAPVPTPPTPPPGSTDDPLCGESDRGFTCTRIPGHPGDHQALTNPNAPPFHTWAQATPPTISTFSHTNQCSESDHGRWACTRTRGHDGDHHAHTDPDATPAHTWAQEQQTNPSEQFEPDLSNRCGADFVSQNRMIYICTRARHDSSVPHIGHYGSGNECGREVLETTPAPQLPLESQTEANLCNDRSGPEAWHCSLPAYHSGPHYGYMFDSREVALERGELGWRTWPNDSSTEPEPEPTPDFPIGYNEGPNADRGLARCSQGVGSAILDGTAQGTWPGSPWWTCSLPIGHSGPHYGYENENAQEVERRTARFVRWPA